MCLVCKVIGFLIVWIFKVTVFLARMLLVTVILVFYHLVIRPVNWIYMGLVKGGSGICCMEMNSFALNLAARAIKSLTVNNTYLQESESCSPEEKARICLLNHIKRFDRWS